MDAAEKISIYQSKFLHVLLSLIIYFVASPFLTANHASNAIISLIFSVLILVSINATANKKYLLISSIFFGALSLITYLQMIFHFVSLNVEVVHYAMIAIFLFIINYAVIMAVAVEREVTPDTLFGAISAYLLLGLTWSYVYLIIQACDPNAFNDHLMGLTIRDKLQHFIYYSFVTLTTVGYGDIVGVSNVARMVSWFEAVTGQIYLAVWISQLVGLRIVEREERSRAKS